MAIWQFWTLIGAIVFMGGNIWALLSVMQSDVRQICRQALAIEDQTRALVGIQAAMSNDVEAIKFRAQRD